MKILFILLAVGLSTEAFANKVIHDFDGFSVTSEVQGEFAINKSGLGGVVGLPKITKSHRDDARKLIAAKCTEIKTSKMAEFIKKGSVDVTEWDIAVFTSEGLMDYGVGETALKAGVIQMDYLSGRAVAEDCVVKLPSTGKTVPIVGDYFVGSWVSLIIKNFEGKMKGGWAFISASVEMNGLNSSGIAEIHGMGLSKKHLKLGVPQNAGVEAMADMLREASLVDDVVRSYEGEVVPSFVATAYGVEQIACAIMNNNLPCNLSYKLSEKCSNRKFRKKKCE